MNSGFLLSCLPHPHLHINLKTVLSGKVGVFRSQWDPGSEEGFSLPKETLGFIVMVSCLILIWMIGARNYL